MHVQMFITYGKHCHLMHVQMFAKLIENVILCTCKCSLNSWKSLSSHARANVRITYEKRKRKNFHQHIAWSEMGNESYMPKRSICRWFHEERTSKALSGKVGDKWEGLSTTPFCLRFRHSSPRAKRASIGRYLWINEWLDVNFPSLSPSWYPPLTTSKKRLAIFFTCNSSSLCK